MLIEAGGPFSVAAARFRDRPALRSGARTATYDELRRAANRAGSGLAGLGVGPGARAGILSHNRAEVVELWLGMERFAQVRVVLHSHFDMATHVRTLNDVGAVALVFDTRFSEALAARRAELTTVRLFVAIGPSTPAWAVSYEEVLGRGGDGDPGLDVDEDAPCFIQLTSGTTGAPKPWVATHRSWRAVIAQNLEHLDTMGAAAVGPVGEDDVSLHFHALQWATGFQTLYPYLLRGALSVVQGDERFDPDAVVDAFAGGATGALVPAPMLGPILDRIEARGGVQHRLRRLVIFFATPELLERTTRVLGKVWCHGFGSTEQGAPTTRLTVGEAEERPGRLASVGRAASPFFEVAVVDARGRRLPARATGEIVVRSAMSASGYWNLPAESAAAFFPGGWFRPGDVGFLDEDGFLYYLDRAKDRILAPAGVVYPHVVESALLRHAAIANCGVVGLGAGGEQEVVAAVMLKAGVASGPALAREIMDAARGGLAEHEVPARVVFVAELPTVLGGAKVQREVLQRRLANP